MDEEIRSTFAAIQERNLRVEADKAWERSSVRIIALVVMTYIIAVAVLYAIGNDRPLPNALIPALGYFISTRSLSFLRKLWSTRRM